jgi:hypothetical protein
LSDPKVEIHKKVTTLASRSSAERLRLIGDELPVLLASAQELADAEKQLPREHQRARAILIGQAEEEAAKILDLLDEREGFLYADLTDHDGDLEWQKPGPRFGGVPIEHDILASNVPRFHALPLWKRSRVSAY